MQKDKGVQELRQHLCVSWDRKSAGVKVSELVDNCEITYQSLGQEINRVGGSLRKQCRERPLLADW